MRPCRWPERDGSCPAQGAEEDQNATFADEGPGGELVELGAFERWIEGPAEVFQRAGITESGVLAPLFDEALVPGVEFVLAEQLEAKQLFNLSPDNAQALKSTAGLSGLTKSQIVNHALKVHFGIQYPMLATRLDVVRAALRNSGPQKPTREATPPPSGTSTNATAPATRKTTPRRSN